MRAWIGDDARRASAVLLARVVGARDLIIAAGTLAHLDEPDALRSWLFAAAAADAADMLLTLADHDAVPAAGRWLIAAIAGTGAGLGVAAVALLED